MGLRLAIDPKVASKYLRTLFAWGVVSQPVYVLVGRDWWDGNILFTLLLGGAAWIGIREVAAGKTARGCAILLAIFPPSAPDGGCEQCEQVAGLRLLAVGPLGVLANFVAPQRPLRRTRRASQSWHPVLSNSPSLLIERSALTSRVGIVP